MLTATLQPQFAMMPECQCLRHHELMYDFCHLCHCLKTALKNQNTKPCSLSLDLPVWLGTVVDGEGEEVGGGRMVDGVMGGSGDGWRGGNGGSSSSSWGNGVGAAAEMVTAVIGLINQARENPVPVAVPKAAAAEPKDAVEGPKEPDVVPKAVVAEPKVEAKPAAEAAQPKAIPELKPAPKDVPAKVSAGPKDVPMSSKPQAHYFCKCDSVLQLLEQNSIFIFLTIALIVS